MSYLFIAVVIFTRKTTYYNVYVLMDYIGLFFFVTYFNTLYSAQFEGSLGKLTTSSVHNPRQIIDKVASATASDGEKGPAKDFRKFKQLLLDIEKV